ncbi:MAG TPA: hypothetical protein PKA12_10105 [Saprospiraceae bacterium]|nr:hypothetical protein [Saprospiraceae bacterium]
MTPWVGSYGFVTQPAPTPLWRCRGYDDVRPLAQRQILSPRKM